MDDEVLAYNLNSLLYNIRCLTHANQFVHWNIVCKDFWGIHKMTNEFYEKLFEFEDRLAEEIRRLNFLVSPVIKKEYVFINEKKYSNYDRYYLLSCLEDDYKKILYFLTDIVKGITSPKHEGTKNLLAELQSELYKHLWFITSSSSKEE